MKHSKNDRGARELKSNHEVERINKALDFNPELIDLSMKEIKAESRHEYHDSEIVFDSEI